MVPVRTDSQDEGAPEPAGGWRWVDGELIDPSYQPWAASNPGDTNSDEDRGEVKGSTLEWNDISASTRYGVPALIASSMQPSGGWSWPEAADTSTGSLHSPRAMSTAMVYDDLVFQTGTDGSENIGVKINNGETSSRMTGVSLYSTELLRRGHSYCRYLG